MDLVSFVVTIVLVTASGALAPGPLFFATLTHGAKQGARSGFVFSVAHTIVEFTLIMLFALGLLTIASEPYVKLVIGVVGGIVLVGFGVMQIRNALIVKKIEGTSGLASYRRLFLIGLAFTGLNPYFKFNLHILKQRLLLEKHQIS
jgi:threonine/homoserine/homoserine lactone efflux protein